MSAPGTSGGTTFGECTRHIGGNIFIRKCVGVRFGRAEPSHDVVSLGLGMTTTFYLTGQTPPKPKLFGTPSFQSQHQPTVSLRDVTSRMSRATE